MKVVFRVDASLDIGTGHVMRCLTLAEALREKGATCHFICREHPGNLQGSIRERNFGVSVLGDCKNQDQYIPEGGDKLPSHASWLGCDWSTDAKQTGKVLEQQKPNWLVVDHYALDRAWENTQRNYVQKLMVIDDLADRSHDCDLLLDQNLGRKESDYIALLPEGCKVMVGPKYSLLRPEFAALREYSLERRKNPKMRNILISMGGVDKHNATSHVLGALKTCPLPADCTISVVLGKNTPWLDLVKQHAKTLHRRIEVLINIDDMAQRIADSDLVIGAAGISSWERCCLGVPTLLVVLADNQRPAAIHLSEAGVAFLIAVDESLEDSLQHYLGSLQQEPLKLAHMSEKAGRITHGEGCYLLVKHMSRWGNV